MLCKAKANYAGTGDEIPDTLEKGAFRPEGSARIKDAVDRIEERLQEKADDGHSDLPGCPGEQAAASVTTRPRGTTHPA